MMCFKGSKSSTKAVTGLIKAEMLQACVVSPGEVSINHEDAEITDFCALTRYVLYIAVVVINIIEFR